MSYLIKPACPNDAPRILSLMDEGIRYWGADILDNLKPWHQMVCTEDYVRNKIAKCNDGILSALNPAMELVGTISVEHADDELCYMGGLYCSEKGKGLGTQLLTKAISFAKAKRYSAMECEIYNKNVPSINLMKKHGAKFIDASTVADVTYERYIFDLN